jgi:metal-responsive CopG/Arc/MetJ family transcriptional regulator
MFPGGFNLCAGGLCTPSAIPFSRLTSMEGGGVARISTVLGDVTADVRRWARREGRTLPEETRILVMEALAARQRGPQPYNVPADRTAAARRMVGLRIPPDLLQLVDEAAKSTGRTRSGEILSRLEDSVAGDNLPEHIVEQLDDLAQLEGISRAELVCQLLTACVEGVEAASSNGSGALLGVAYPADVDPFDQLEQEARALGAVDAVESS